MTKIPWNTFTRSELVAILETMDEQSWLIERLDPVDNHYLTQGCTCDVVVETLPSAIVKIRDNALRRSAGPLARLLRRGPIPQRKQA